MKKNIVYFVFFFILSSFDIFSMDLDQDDKILKNNFSQALLNRDIEQITNLIKICPNLVNKKIHIKGFTYPIIFAATNGDKDIVNILIENGAEVNLANQMDYNALHAACKANQEEIVKILLKNKADINTVSNSIKLTPLMISVYNENISLVKLLLSYGANVNLALNKWAFHLAPMQTPLMIACEKNNYEIVRNLLNSKGIDILIKDNIYYDDLPKEHIAYGENFGKNALLYAKDQKIKELIQNRLNKDTLKKELFEAIISKNINKFKELAKKVTLAVYDENGNNPLHYAVQVGDENLVALVLIANPGLICQKNNKGQLPMELALNKQELFKKINNLILKDVLK